MFGENWSYSFGINEGHRPRPWDAPWGLGTPTGLGEGTYSFADYKFSLSTEANDPAEMYINGDNYYFGGRDSSGNLATEPVVASNESVVFYTNHGGKTHMNHDAISEDQEHYYDAFVDTIFAYRQWPRIWSNEQNRFIDGLSGIIDIQHDQVKFGRSIQPYALDFPNMYQNGPFDDVTQTKERNVRVSVYDEKVYGDDPMKRKNVSGEEVTIGWNFRTDKSTRIGYMETSPTYTPVKSFPFMTEGMQAEVSRYPADTRNTLIAQEVCDLEGPAPMPEVLLTVSTGDLITQMRVSGATKADPFHLYVTGGHTGYGIVREFTSLASNYFNPGEGCHAAIFMDGGAHIGLGSRDWNEHSKNAWSILGHDYVTLYPNGNCFVWVENDLVVADRLPIMPTENFGAANPGYTQVLTYTKEDQRITFYSEKPREIRVPLGCELDLSAFGRPEGTVVERFAPQQIEFAGKLKLVLEPGSRIRFPQTLADNPSGPNGKLEPVLYFNDESEIIFEGVEDRDEQIWDDYVDSDAQRTKILGIGQIWLNKNAKMRINDTALVGIETDDATWTTSISISIQRQGQMLIGTDNVAGGAFQVGNPVYRSSPAKTYRENGTPHSISFVLRLGGPLSEFQLQREGFFGLGAGIINKVDEPDGAWRLEGLYNVDWIFLNFIEGVFSHNRIYDTDDSRSSLVAIGPVNNGYEVTLGDRELMFVRGGGNMIYMANAGDIYPAAKPPHDTKFVESAATITPGTTGDYTIMASTPSIRQRTGAGIVQNESFYGNAAAFYNYMGYPPFFAVPSSYVTFGRTQKELRIGYIVGDGTNTIVREVPPEPTDDSNPEDSLEFGSLKASPTPAGLLNSVSKGR